LAFNDRYKQRNRDHEAVTFRVSFFDRKIDAAARFSRFDATYAAVRSLRVRNAAARGLRLECGRARNENEERGCKGKHADSAHEDLRGDVGERIGIALRSGT